MTGARPSGPGRAPWPMKGTSRKATERTPIAESVTRCWDATCPAHRKRCWKLRVGLLIEAVLRGDPRSGRGQRLDLNPELRIDEAFHLHQGTGRGPAMRVVLVAELPEGLQVGQIGEVDRQLHDLLHRGARCGESGRKVAEHLPGLGARVAAPDQVSVLIQRDLARDHP